MWFILMWSFSGTVVTVPEVIRQFTVQAATSLFERCDEDGETDASTASSATRLRNTCCYGRDHPAISNAVITITNTSSFWHSCPRFVQYEPAELMQQSAELFHFHCYCSWFVFYSGAPPTPLIPNKYSQCFIVLELRRGEDLPAASGWLNLMCQYI